jgi:hypothetical protein
MTKLLLSPLSKAKSTVIKNIESSTHQEQKNIQQQLQNLTKEISENVLKTAEEELRIQIQKRETQERAKKEKSLQEVQLLLTKIIQKREALVRNKPTT